MEDTYELFSFGDKIRMSPPCVIEIRMVTSSHTQDTLDDIIMHQDTYAYSHLHSNTFWIAPHQEDTHEKGLMHQDTFGKHEDTHEK